MPTPHFWNSNLSMLECSSRFAKLRDRQYYITICFHSFPESCNHMISCIYVCHSFDCRHNYQSIHSFPRIIS
ncbi:hypothetical protein GQ43DRAFT_51795 [Delitschia confertaspora ATCC 74209]|uniref:Uncharacterized protein n=1 Tax=Delitschia confertaspora ATCC 74209 TaxID=1513339 RepID=A0A9P4JVK5_9PLEO|nr:hypothetical protein GQ43DRAFT_51795 [Delitschia confertaspora ATCC 74209]